ncbi:oligosaccharide flippase family protein [Variovorax sp. YR752]|uniref:lipopolysaccharide biosynthesis protein n=1 Tax=Variovorax sp. YR752 TaxID=1884383 RepID=UPI0031380B04
MIGALWRDGAIYAAGAILARGIALLMLPLYTRVLAPADYGALDLIVTCGVLINLVVPLETAQALARFWNEREAGQARRRLAGTAWSFTLAGYALFAAVTLPLAEPIAHALLGDARFSGALRAGLAFIAINGLFLLLQNQFRWELRPRAYAAVSVLYALLTMALVTAFALGLGAGLEGVLWAQFAAAALCTGLSLWWLRGKLSLVLHRADLAEMLRFSLPLVPAGIAVFASFYINRLMLNALATLDDVGQFGIASRLAGMVTLVLVGIQGALTPLIYAHHHEPETPARLARLFEGFVAVALVACLAIGLFGRELIATFATADYASAAPLLMWLAPAALLAQMYIFAPGIAIAKKTSWQLLITLCSALLGAALNWMLIPIAGPAGAALATLAAAALFFGAWLVASQKLYPMPLRGAALAAATALFTLVALAVPALDAALGAGPVAWVAKLALLAVIALSMFPLGLLRAQSLRGLFARAS